MNVGRDSATGTGPNKKLAKRSAAENLLEILGYSRPQPLLPRPVLKGACSPQQGAHTNGEETSYSTNMSSSTTAPESSSSQQVRSCDPKLTKDLQGAVENKAKPGKKVSERPSLCTALFKSQDQSWNALFFWRLKSWWLETKETLQSVCDQRKKYCLNSIKVFKKIWNTTYE